MCRSIQSPAVIVALLAVGCAGHTPYDPFLVPQGRIFGAVRTVALAPVVVPRELSRGNVGRARFDSLVTSQLRAAGFGVVPPDSTQAVWQQITDSLGGLFDPATGARDSVKFDRARRLTMAALRQRFGADAWLHPFVIFAPAKFDRGTATWDGARQSYQSFGAKFLAAFLGNETYGRTAALSFFVDLQDLDGLDLYVNQGGLQLYQKPNGRRFEEIPVSELYADPVRNAKAVELALLPLIARRKP